MVDENEKSEGEGNKKRSGEETTVHGVEKEAGPAERREALFKSEQAAVMVASGPEAGLVVPIGEGITIGRDPASVLQLSDPSVSRNHFQISKTESGHIIKDLGSSNGTLLNGKDVTAELPIPRQGTINAGIYELIFFDPEASEAEATEGVDEGEVEAEEEAEAKPEEEAGEGEVAEEEGAAEEGEAEGEGEESEALVKAEEQALAEVEEPGLPAIPVIARKLKGVFLLAMIVVGVIVLFFIGRFAYHALYPAAKLAKEGGKVLETDKYVDPTIKRVYPFLEITAEPFPARIWFNGKDLGLPRAQPLTYKETEGLEPGVEYELKALFKLEELDDEVNVLKYLSFVPGEQYQTVKVKANIGVIHIKQVPGDVVLYLEYVPMGVGAPGEEKIRKITEINYKIPIFVPHGKFKLELRRGEDILYRRQFEINDKNPARELSVTEEELTYAPIEVLTDPSGAEVYIDENLIGTTPIYLDKGKMPFGDHELKIAKEDYLSVIKKVNVEVDEPIHLDIKLDVSEAGEYILKGKGAYLKGLYKQVEYPMLQAMKLNPTKREKAKIHYYLGMAYKELGVLDQALIHLASSQKHEDFKLKGKIGEAWVYFEKGEKKRALDMCIEVLSETDDIEIKLSAEQLFGEISPLRCAIYINSNPTGATVYLNNNKVPTKTPVIVYDLYPGKYRVMMKKPNYETVYDKFDISIGRFLPLYYELKRIP